jgi:hypothetical protein
MSEQFNQPSEDSNYAPEAGDTGFLAEGGTQQATGDLYETLSAYGVPDDVREQVKSAALRQDDYTRKTQELADTRRALEAQQMQLNQLATWALQQNSAGQQGQSYESNFDRAWKDMVKDGNEEQAKPIRALFDAKDADAVARIRPLELQLAQYQAKEAFQQEYETTVKPYFGTHLDTLWRDAEAVSMQQLQQGRVVTPMAVISQLAPEKLLEAAKKAAAGQRNTGLPSEGMVNYRQEQPVVGAVGKPQGDPSSTANILKEVQAMMNRGRPSA